MTITTLPATPNDVKQDGSVPQTSITDEAGALRWLIANRRPEVSIDHALSVLGGALPYDPHGPDLMQRLRRIAAEVETQQSANPLN